MQHSNCLVCRPPTTSFSERPIGTVATLAKMLRLPLAELESLAATANKRYRIGKQITKPNGDIRTCYDALGVLKSTQARIQCMILNQVDYPPYLQGSIRDPQNPRGQRPNAALHTRKRTIITEDLKSYFPSVGEQIVFGIWHRFFRFPPPVASLLTKLTTKDGELPQGTKTSPLLSNLVFWDVEWKLVEKLHQQGITYSRLIDDITCSSKTDFTTKQTTEVIKALHAMAAKKGLKLNDGKQTIARAGERHLTTKLVVNVKTSLPLEQRAAIRAAVRRAQAAPSNVRATERFQKGVRKVSGRIGYLKQHHPKEAEALRSKLRRET